MDTADGFRDYEAQIRRKNYMDGKICRGNMYEKNNKDSNGEYSGCEDYH